MSEIVVKRPVFLRHDDDVINRGDVTAGAALGESRSYRLIGAQRQSACVNTTAGAAPPTKG